MSPTFSPFFTANSSSLAECIGPAIGALLTTPDKVQRTDGTKVHIAKPLSTKEELKALLKLSYDRRILLTIPLCFYAIFQASWVGSFLTQYFSGASLSFLLFFDFLLTPLSACSPRSRSRVPLRRPRTDLR